MVGAARRVDGGPDRLDPGSKWSAPLYSCATALKAYIMDVSFFINGTSSLANLQVESMKPRSYSSNMSVPLWAVEDTELNIADVAPFWAVVDEKYESWPHMWTLRKDHLYLPAGSGSLALVLSTISAVASAYAPEAALYAVYSEAASSLDHGVLPDYSGLTNYPLFPKWQDLSKSPDTASTIVNLIWTDIMANYVLGTKSTLNANSKFATRKVNSTGQDAKGSMNRVLQSDRRVQYDLRYGIPGIVFLAFYAAVIVSALSFWITGRVRFQYLRTILNQTATGRIMTVERHGDAACAPAVGTRKWIQVFGEEDIGIRNPRLAGKMQDIESESEGAATESAALFTSMTTTTTTTTTTPTTMAAVPLRPENDRLLQ